MLPYEPPETSADNAHSAVNVYVGKSPFGFVSERGEVNTPVFPQNVFKATVGVDMPPLFPTPTIVALTVTFPPTKSEDFTTPSTSAVPIYPSAARVESVSYPPVTVNSPKSCAW